MNFEFDLDDKHMEYAFVQFASKLDADACQNLLAGYVSSKMKKEKLIVWTDPGSALEAILLLIIEKFLPEKDSPGAVPFVNTIGRVSRKQLKAMDAQPLLSIQHGLEVEHIRYYFNYGDFFVSDGLATWGKATSFCRDEKFLSLAEKHSNLLPIANWHWNLSVALWCAKRALKLDGDFVELGVFKGHTTVFLAEYLDFSKIDKNWYLYDTFTGIPAEDLNNESWVEVNMGIYVDTYTYAEVADRFSAYPNIDVIQGRVPDIFVESPPPSKIAFLHIDLNSAKAEVAALESIFDSIVSGGMILFDDYGWAVCDEQHQAINVWAQGKSLDILELPTGQGLLVVTSKPFNVFGA